MSRNLLNGVYLLNSVLVVEYQTKTRVILCFFQVKVKT